MPKSKRKAPAAPKKKQRRSDEERLADHLRKARQIEERMRMQKVKELAAEDDEAKRLARDVRVLNQAKSILEEREVDSDLIEAIDEVLTDIMREVNKRIAQLSGDEEDEDDEEEDEEEDDEED